MWFASGVVMMYVGYPKLTPAERLEHLPALVPATLSISPAQALQAAGMSAARELRLIGNAGGRPAYLIAAETPPGMRRSGSGPKAPVIVFADNGEVARGFDAAAATRSAAVFRRDSTGGGLEYLGSVDEDACTHSAALDAHRPLHLFRDTQTNASLYVSSTTGEVVRDATAGERFWNFTGAWIHWLYPFRGNLFDAYWHDIVVWLSLAGTILGISGLITGILRWRFRRRYASGSRSPYRKAWMRWHHMGGLLFGVIAITWIFSGLMSMNPWKVFDSGAARPRLDIYAGGRYTATDLHLPGETLHRDADIRELVWTGSAGRHLLLAYQASGRPDVLDVRSGEPVTFSRDEILVAATALLPDAGVREVQILDRYDTYYYSRAPHTMLGHTDKPLPAWRIIYGDGNATWVHLDPATGAYLGSLDDHGRIKRWLFAFLHSFDWLPLLENRPLWDVLLVVLSLGGGIMSLTGIGIGWQRLTRKAGA